MSIVIDLNPTPELRDFISGAVREAVQTEIQPLIKKARTKLSRNDVSSMIGRSLPTVDKYTQVGILKRYKQGGRYFYYEDEVETAFIEMEASQ